MFIFCYFPVDHRGGDGDLAQVAPVLHPSKHMFVLESRRWHPRTRRRPPGTFPRPRKVLASTPYNPAAQVVGPEVKTQFERPALPLGLGKKRW